MNRTEIECRVVDAIGRIAGELGFAQDQIGPDTSLIDDIGLDSLRFVDLTVGLEDALGIDVFPMQDWADAELEIGGPTRLVVRNLVEECVRLLAIEGRVTQ